MRLDCDIVLDLLPLYAEDLLREGSERQVEEHLCACQRCRSALQAIREPQLSVDLGQAEPMRRFRRAFRRHTLTVGVLSAFFAVAVMILIWGLFFLYPGDEMGYALLCFYLLLPLAALVCALLLGMREHAIKWLSPLVFGLFGYLLPWPVFHNTDPVYFLFVFVPALAGLLTGCLVRALRRRREKRS